MEKKKRRRYFVYPAIQFNFIVLLAGSGMILSLFYSIFFLYIYSQSTSSLLLLVEGNTLLEKYLLTTERLLLIGCILIILLSTLFLATLALLHSHRVAGPLYRLEKILEEMKRGKIPKSIKLRKGDRVTRLATLLEELGKKIQEEEEKREKIKELMEAIDTTSIPKEVKEKIEKIKSLL